MFSLVRKLSALCTKQVHKYGAQYFSFAIFGLINYPFAYLYELYNNSIYETSPIRILPTFLCLGLLIKDFWPSKAKKYLPLFWYTTIMFSLPMLTTYLLLKNNFAFSWLMNFNVGVMIVVLLLDSISFLIVELIGITSGAIIFYFLGGEIAHFPSKEEMDLFIYVFFCTVILGTIFTRNKEIFNHYNQKSKDDLNKILEETVFERTRELETALSIKNELLNNVSHEIRTPVHGFTVISEGLVNQWDNIKDEKKLNYAKNIAENATRLEKFLNQLLDMSKYNAKRITMCFKHMDLNESIKSIIEECHRLYLFNRSIDLNFKTEKDKIKIIADKEKIEQVLRNLLFNAIKFTQDGGLIEVFSSSDKQKAYVSVSDTGIGVPEEELQSIFEPFSQSSRTKTGAGGTGLGLSISKSIITEHKGLIWAENNQKSGSIFKFTIPVRQK